MIICTRANTDHSCKSYRRLLQNTEPLPITELYQVTVDGVEGSNTGVIIKQ